MPIWASPKNSGANSLSLQFLSRSSFSLDPVSLSLQFLSRSSFSLAPVSLSLQFLSRCTFSLALLLSSQLLNSRARYRSTSATTWLLHPATLRPRPVLQFKVTSSEWGSSSWPVPPEGQTFLEADVAQSAGKKTSCSSLSSSYSSHFRSSALAMRPFLLPVA